MIEPTDRSKYGYQPKESIKTSPPDKETITRRVCRYGNDINPNCCAGCQYGCIVREVKTLNNKVDQIMKDVSDIKLKH